jgi:hypothetical protein
VRCPADRNNDRNNPEEAGAAAGSTHLATAAEEDELIDEPMDSTILNHARIIAGKNREA